MLDKLYKKHFEHKTYPLQISFSPKIKFTMRNGNKYYEHMQNTNTMIKWVLSRLVLCKLPNNYS